MKYSAQLNGDDIAFCQSEGLELLSKDNVIEITEEQYVNNEVLGKRYNTASLLWEDVVLDDNCQYIKVENIDIAGLTCNKVGNIWWLDKGTAFTIVGTPTVPDALQTEFVEAKPFVLMAEQVIDGSKTQKDVRFKATLKHDEFKLESVSGYAESGNYIIRAARLNEGLERIEAPFRVEFDTIEFDVLQG